MLLSLGLDFLFLFSYAGAIGLGCVMAARGLSQRMKTFSLLGAPLAWGQLYAALLDAAENISLMIGLYSDINFLSSSSDGRVAQCTCFIGLLSVH